MRVLKRIFICLVTVMMIVPVFTVFASADIFTDVKNNSWYDDAVYYCYERGFLSGTGTKSFAPSAPLTRAEMAVVLAAVSLEDLGGYTYSVYPDVSPYRYYTGAISWCRSNKIASDDGMGNFNPDSYVTREQACVFLYALTRHLGLNLSTISSVSFPDFNQTSSWAQDAVKWAYKHSLVSGNEYGYFNPKSVITRAELAAILMAYNKNIRGNVSTSNTKKIFKSPSGERYEYTKKYDITATAYTYGEGGNTTSTGRYVSTKYIAVDYYAIQSGLFSYHQYVYVADPNGIYDIGVRQIEDCSKNHKGYWCDIFLPTSGQCYYFGRRAMTLYFIK